jgi:signal transduction histidine kinase
LENRLRETEQKKTAPSLVSLDVNENFGEVLRHEVNNPLTGILGNAELLLAEVRRRDDGRLPEATLQRLQTIAELAVRLRETVRRLSCDLEARTNHARSV